MILRGDDGTVFELELAPSEFAEDDQWLTVAIRVEGPPGTWRARFPCLLRAEADDLVRWLELVADDQEVEPALEFGEPNLAFEKRGADDGRVTLRVILRAEFLPPWARAGAEGDGGEARLDLTVSRDGLRAAARELAQRLQRLPRR